MTYTNRQNHPHADALSLIVEAFHGEVLVPPLLQATLHKHDILATPAGLQELKRRLEAPRLTAKVAVRIRVAVGVLVRPQLGAHLEGAACKRPGGHGVRVDGGGRPPLDVTEDGRRWAEFVRGGGYGLGLRYACWGQAYGRVRTNGWMGRWGGG
eukprot:352949-Chlamydomonas_euryale.AAC.8